MKKHFIKFMFVAVAFGMVASLNVNAENENTESVSESSILIDRSDNVSLKAENAAQEGVTAVSMSLNVRPSDENDSVENVVFDFDESNNAKITEYRYHEDTGQLNVYMADANPIFRNSDTMSLGSVSAYDAEGNNVDVDITVPENSLSILSKNELATTSPNVKNKNTVFGNDYMDIQKVYPTSYLITIPDSSDEISEGDTFTVTAEDVLIEHGQMLNVSVSSENGWNLTDAKNPDNPEKVKYSMKFGYDDTEIKGKSETILSVTDGRTADSVELIVDNIETPKTAGTFSDTLTFDISVR